MFTLREYQLLRHGLILFPFAESDGADALALIHKLDRITRAADEVIVAVKYGVTLQIERVKVFETARELARDLFILAPIEKAQTALVWLPESLVNHYFKEIAPELHHESLGMTADPSTRTLSFDGGLKVTFAFSVDAVRGQGFDFAYVYNTEYGE